MNRFHIARPPTQAASDKCAAKVRLAHKSNAQDLTEHGAVLVLLAILSVVIVVFIALAIDTASYSVSSNQQQSTAQLAALAALDRYANTPLDPAMSELANHRVRLTAAIDRAEEIIGSEFNRLFSQRGGPQLDAVANELADASGVTGRTNDAAGTLTPGQYFYTEPFGDCAQYLARFPDTGSDACPCKNGSWNGECFRPLGAGETVATAFDVRLKTKDALPLRAYFGPVFGQAEQAIVSAGRSALIPSAGVYAIDLSLSGTYESHLPYDVLFPSNTDRASNYVFQLSGTGASQCNASHANPCVATGSCTFTTPGQSCTFYGLGNDDRGRPCVSVGMLANRPASGLQEQWRHYRDDYECFALDLDGAPGVEHYLVDTSIHDVLGGGKYYGPEPLTGIFAGIHSALQRIEQRPLAGDTIAVMGFDQSVQYDRTSTDNTNGRVIGPTFPGRASFNDLKDITNTQLGDDATLRANQLKRIQFGFITRPGANTDIPEAILEAQFLLGSLGADLNAKKFVTMITDGINNCVHWTGGPGMPQHEHWTHFLYRDPWDNTVRLFQESCVVPLDAPPWDEGNEDWFHPNGWDFHAGGLGEAATMVSSFDLWALDDPRPHNMRRYYFMKQAGLPTYVHQKIQFNAVIYGGQPHTLLKKSQTGQRCLSDVEARKEDQLYTAQITLEPGANPPTSSNVLCYHRIFSDDQCPYYMHNDAFYRLMVKPTGGYFYALRKPCDMDQVQALAPDQFVDVSQCKTGAFRQKLDEVCGASTGEPFSTVRHAGLAAAGVLDDRMNTRMNDDGSIAETYRTQHNRLVCDDLCRSTTEQFNDLIDQIYSEKPYILADERDREVPPVPPAN